MPVTEQEQTNPCEVWLKIEVEPDKVARAFDEAYREFAAVTEVPGFRKGKAPRPVLERYVPEERVLAVAKDKLVGPAYEQALEETGIKPFGTAQYEVVSFTASEPFVFKAKVPLAPSVELGTYVGLEAERLVTQVSEEDVEHQIEVIRERAAEVTNVGDRPVQEGDLVVLRLTDADGDTKELATTAGKNLPSFDEGVIGMSLGQMKTIQVVYPEDYHDKDRSGTRSYVTVTVTAIQERKVPDLTDEFVRRITEKTDEKSESVEEFRTKIRSSLERAASELADRQVELNILEAVVANSKICFPDFVLDREVAERLQELLSELKAKDLTLDDYLRATDRTFEQLRSSIESAAQRSIRVGLVFNELARREDIGVSEEEIEATVRKMAEESGLPKESFDAYLDKTNKRQEIQTGLLRRKVLDFLVHASNIKHVGRTSS